MSGKTLLLIASSVGNFCNIHYKIEDFCTEVWVKFIPHKWGEDPIGVEVVAGPGNLQNLENSGRIRSRVRTISLLSTTEPHSDGQLNSGQNAARYPV